MVKQTLDWKKHLRACFGEYVEADVDPDITNTLEPRTFSFSGIYLRPTRNIQGTVRVFDIVTGKVKKEREFTRMGMPDRVIRAVEKWSKKLHVMIS